MSFVVNALSHAHTNMKSLILIHTPTHTINKELKVKSEGQTECTYNLLFQCRFNLVSLYAHVHACIHAHNTTQTRTLLFQYLFQPHATTVAGKKDPSHSAKSAGGRLQLNTHAPSVCGITRSGNANLCMVYGVHRMCTETAAVLLQ